MPVELSMLANALLSLAVDKAQSAAKEHIMKAINENLDEDAKKMLDDAIDGDSSHGFKKLTDMLDK